MTSGIPYMVLNAILSAVMIAYSFNVDSKIKNTQGNNLNTVVNMILFLSALFAFMAATLATVFWAPANFAKVMGSVTFILISWFSVQSCAYILTFPEQKKPTGVLIAQIILDVVAFLYIVFFPGAFYAIGIDINGSFHIYSQHVFSEIFRGSFSMSYFYLFLGYYMIVIPLFTLIMVLVKAENSSIRITKQNLRLNAAAVASSWAIFVVIVYASKYQTMMFSLSVFCFIPELMLMIGAYKTEEIWDRKTVFRAILRFTLRYLIPGLIAGLIWVITWPMFTRTPAIFTTLYMLVIMGMMIAWQHTATLLSNIDFLRSARYEVHFEEDLSSIDFEGEINDIVTKVFQVFHRYVDTSSMHVLVDGGNGILETVYSSKNLKYQIPIDDECFEVLLSQKHPVVFREYAQKDYGVAIVRQSLLRLMDSTSSNAFIMLHEGNHVIGLIFLGPKESGNVYNDYDYEVFNNLYSNLFVIGYYLKNILNESIVGTVNREIRMSGQIITSIQENMDHVKSEKADIGYRMIPAHNIGGEFVDLIRLNDKRHIFIIGALNSRGIAASMNMVILKSIIRTYLADTTDFKLLVEKVNTFIRESLPKGTYFAGTFALMDFSTDTMYYINCGSPAIFLYTKSYNNVIEIQGEGRILGFAKNISQLIKVKKIKLSDGDIVLSCTDGLIDSLSLRGVSFGKERVQKALLENASFPAEKMAQFEYDSLVQFTSKEIDNDVTVFVLKYKNR